MLEPGRRGERPVGLPGLDPIPLSDESQHLRRQTLLNGYQLYDASRQRIAGPVLTVFVREGSKSRFDSFDWIGLFHEGIADPLQCVEHMFASCQSGTTESVDGRTASGLIRSPVRSPSAFVFCR